MLQVELAALTYQRSRLVRSWTHLERQRGGFGFLGGPGETQIELDRRQIADRIAASRASWRRSSRTRGLHREARRRRAYPVVALVGYTNAGKSTLFNRLTGAAVVARDQLFATLDPTMRAVALPSGASVILSDTVGFISDLPTELVAAFRATLEEVQEADLILHVRDISHPDAEAQSATSSTVLNELGIDAGHREARMVEVWNKIDLPHPRPARRPRGRGRAPRGRRPPLRQGRHRPRPPPRRRRRAPARHPRDRRAAPSLRRRRDPGLAPPPRRRAGADGRRRGPAGQGGAPPGRAGAAGPAAGAGGITAREGKAGVLLARAHSACAAAYGSGRLSITHILCLARVG